MSLVMVTLRSGSQIAMSASAPILMEPFCGYMPYSFAALVEFNATKRFRSIRPLMTPSETTEVRASQDPGCHWPRAGTAPGDHASIFRFHRNDTARDRKRECRTSRLLCLAKRDAG